jgi:hypothetical protein
MTPEAECGFLLLQPLLTGGKKGHIVDTRDWPLGGGVWWRDGEYATMGHGRLACRCR